MNYKNLSPDEFRTWLWKTVAGDIQPQMDKHMLKAINHAQQLILIDAINRKMQLLNMAVASAVGYLDIPNLDDLGKEDAQQAAALMEVAQRKVMRLNA